ncbi:hypothetical protein BDZ89DRAFT_1111785 [Hymenopellis radicata]|nr:hypothetical protein BDZ89DRAFT_1111785 [Hymenopellis radicata]
MPQNEFMLGVAPFLFKIKGGPMPPSFAVAQNSFAELVMVYQAGPQQKGHVAYREYEFRKRLSEIMTDSFMNNIAALSDMDPYQMFEAIPGSKGLQLFRELYLEAKRWRMDDGPGSLRQMKRDADRQAQDDGAYFRLDESPPPKNNGPAAQWSADTQRDETPDSNRRSGTGQVQESLLAHARQEARVTERMLRRRSVGPSSMPRDHSTRQSSHAPQRGLRNLSPSDSSELSDATSDDDLPLHLREESVKSLRRRGMHRNQIYKLLLTRRKEPTLPSCSECEKMGAVCYKLVGKKGKTGKWPACLRCEAMALFVHPGLLSLKKRQSQVSERLGDSSSDNSKEHKWKR